MQENKIKPRIILVAVPLGNRRTCVSRPAQNIPDRMEDGRQEENKAKNNVEQQVPATLFARQKYGQRRKEDS